jgi:hypothetical protein
LKEFDPTLHRSLTQLKEFEGDVENTFGLNFQISLAEVDWSKQKSASSSNDAESDNNNSSPAESHDAATASPAHAGATMTHTYNLLPNGENIMVTNSNLDSYLSLYTQQALYLSAKPQIDAFIQGFQQITQCRSLRVLFTPKDLELLIVGKQSLDFTKLRKTTRYEGGFHINHPTVVDFWQIILEELTPEQKEQFLIFISGTNVAPVGGLGDLRMTIQRAGPDTDRLPTSSTCFHTLLLPEYSSKEKLSAKLKIALSNNRGFGLQ